MEILLEIHVLVISEFSKINTKDTKGGVTDR